MMLIDAGPMISLFVTRDRNHMRCLNLISTLRTPLHTTWPAVAEAMYFLDKYVGWPAQRGLWQMIRNKQILVAHLEEDTVERTYELMEKYSDVPMDLADATLCALAEHLNCKKIFTLDSDFKIYKFKNRAAYQVVPG
jgi:predicted nucleic acid-binding protein